MAGGDAVTALINQISRAVGEDMAGGCFCVGEVVRAGQGDLKIRRGELPLDREDLYVNPTLDWRWTVDTGGTELLRAGDRVVLLTLDDQTYYLVCRAVRP